MFNKLFLILKKQIFIPNRKILIVASLIAIFITGLMMTDFLIISTDFSYIQFDFDYISGTKNMGSHVYVYPKTAKFDISNVGKATFGQGGFPLSYLTDCTLIKRDNNKIYPDCQSMSLGQDSIAPLLMPFLDIFVWTFFSYSLLTFIQALRKKVNRRKSTLIFILAIAVLIISVFANSFIGSMMKL